MTTIELNGSAVSKTIKDMLKAKFPKTKFSVRYESFSGGDSVSISYEFGPALDTVENLVDPYQSGRFNSMEDMYEYRKNRIVETKDGEFELNGGVKYINVTKDFPYDRYDELRQQFQNLFPFITDKEDIRKTIRATYMRTDFLSSNPKNLKISKKPGDNSGWENMIQFEFDIPAEIVSEPVKTELLEYSEYAIAVFGKVFDKSKELKEHGRFNRFLTHPLTKEKTPGWIFPKKKVNQVKNILMLP